jgi:hypothetical protein
MKKQKLTDEEILLEMYRRMFKESEPSGNIDKIIKSGEGKKHNFFLKYYLPEERQTEIINEVCKENGIKNKYEIRQFHTACALGSSPTSQKNLIPKNKIKKSKIERKYWSDKALKEDKKYFKIQVEKGIKRLAGVKTKERLRNCYHCKLWNKAEKFIKEVESL